MREQRKPAAKTDTAGKIRTWDYEVQGDQYRTIAGIQGGNLVGDNNGGNLIINLPPTLTRAAGGSIDFATAGAGTTTFRSTVANIASGVGSGIIGRSSA